MSKENKMDHVIDAMNLVLKLLSDRDRLSIVTFNETSYRNCKFRVLTPKNKFKILKFINTQLKCQGRLSNVLSGIQKGFKALRERMYSSPETHVFLISDRPDNSWVSEAELMHEVNQVITLPAFENVVVSTFALGASADSALLKRLAEVKKGNLYFVQQPHQLRVAFVDCFSNMFSCAIKRVNLSLQFDEVYVASAQSADQLFRQTNKAAFTHQIVNLCTQAPKSYLF